MELFEKEMDRLHTIIMELENTNKLSRTESEGLMATLHNETVKNEELNEQMTHMKNEF